MKSIDASEIKKDTLYFGYILVDAHDGRGFGKNTIMFRHLADISIYGGIAIEVISSFNDQDYLPYESMWARGFAHEHTMTYELTREEELLALSEMI